MSVDKTYRTVERDNKYMPALVSLNSGKVLKLYRDLADTDKETVESRVKGMKDEKSKSKSKKKSKSKSKKKPQTQSDFIRTLIRRNAKRETILERLVEEFGDEENGKDESWAKSRMYTYERAYGEMGENDPKL